MRFVIFNNIVDLTCNLKKMQFQLITYYKDRVIYDDEIILAESNYEKYIWKKK